VKNYSKLHSLAKCYTVGSQQQTRLTTVIFFGGGEFFGSDLRVTIFRRQRLNSAADGWQRSNFLISPFNVMHSLGGPCGDIHLGHFKKHELN